MVTILDGPPPADDLPHTHFVESSKGRLAYQEVGEGPVVILIHGGGPGAYGHSNYRKNIQALADRGNRVVVVDLPGFGQSDYRGKEGGLFVPAADAILELIDQLGVEQASLVGNSLGGGVALRTALTAPDKVAKLILMGPGGSLPATSVFPSEGLMRILSFYEGDGPTLEKLERVIDHLVYDRSQITPELVKERFRVATLPQTIANPPMRGAAIDPHNELWREPLNTLTHPTLMLWGREDKVLPLDMAFIYLKRIPNVDLHVFANCGHWVQWEKPDEFNKIVADFLEK